MSKRLLRKSKSSKNILDTLDAYASSFLTTQVDAENGPRDSNISEITVNGIKKISIRQKKKLRKLRRMETENFKTLEALEESHEIVSPKKKKSIKERFIEDMGIVLPITNESGTPQDEPKSLLNGKSTFKVDDKIVEFRDLAKKNPKKIKSSIVDEPESDTTSSKVNHFDMKRARYEVLRFGISGFEKKSKEEANIALAIKLGAKPPKNTYKNYKELIEEKKKLKEVELEDANSNVKPGLLRTTSLKKRQSRDNNKVAGFDSQIGRFKNGVQIVSQREIQKVTRGSKKIGKISAIKGI